VGLRAGLDGRKISSPPGFDRLNLLLVSKLKDTRLASVRFMWILLVHRPPQWSDTTHIYIYSTKHRQIIINTYFRYSW